jgi:hypothetical protein
MFALGIHALALAVYVGLAVYLLVKDSHWDMLATKNSGPPLGLLLAIWLTNTGALVWILGLIGLITWWLQRRPELVPHVVRLDLLLWLGLWLLLFLPWERTRRVIIPPPWSLE